MLAAVEQAQSHWVQVSSRKAENRESYKIDFAHDPAAFPEPKWPASMETLVEVSFHGRMIEDVDHPALARLIGRKHDMR